MAALYWWSDDKGAARTQLGAVFLLILATTGISVRFNFLGSDFYNALSNKDQEQFTKQLTVIFFNGKSVWWNGNCNQAKRRDVCAEKRQGLKSLNFPGR